MQGQARRSWPHPRVARLWIAAGAFPVPWVRENRPIMPQSEPHPRRAAARVRRRRVHLEACRELSARLLEATTVEEVAQLTVEAVVQASGASAALLVVPYRFGSRDEMLYEHGSLGPGERLPEEVVQSVLTATLARNAPTSEADAPAFLRRQGLPPVPWMHSFIAVPLRLGVIPVGAVLACNPPSPQELPRRAEEIMDLVRPVPHAFSHCWFVRTSARDLRILEAIQESAGSMLAYLDRDLRFVQVNSAFADMLGLPREQLLGAALTEVMSASHSLVTACRQAVENCGAASAHEAPQVSEQATGYWNWHVTPILDHLGTIEGVVVSMQEVTAQVHAREQLLEAERVRARMAEALNAELNHRIKNNLAMVASLLRMQLDDAMQEEGGAEAIRQAIQRLRALAAVHEQLCDTQVGEVEIVDVIRRVATNAGRTLGGEQVQVAVAGEALHCPARTATIVSVVTNELITNAVKHGRSYEGGPPAIRVDVGRHGGELRLAVWNSGGLPSADAPPSREQLGLRLVQELVSQCEGRFALTAHEGGVLAQVVLEEARLGEGDAGGSVS